MQWQLQPERYRHLPELRDHRARRQGLSPGGPDVSPKTLLQQTVKRGSLICTDKFGFCNGFAAHIFRHKRIDHSNRIGIRKFYINGIEGY